VGSGLQHNSNCYVQEALEVWAVVCSRTVTVMYRKGEKCGQWAAAPQ